MNKKFLVVKLVEHPLNIIDFGVLFENKPSALKAAQLEAMKNPGEEWAVYKLNCVYKEKTDE